MYFYKRFKNVRLYHFCPAPGYDCPASPGNCDYEVVKIVKAPKGSTLLNRRVIIAWGGKTIKAGPNAVYAKNIDGLTSNSQLVIAC